MRTFVWLALVAAASVAHAAEPAPTGLRWTIEVADPGRTVGTAEIAAALGAARPALESCFTQHGKPTDDALLSFLAFDRKASPTEVVVGGTGNASLEKCVAKTLRTLKLAARPMTRVVATVRLAYTPSAAAPAQPTTLESDQQVIKAKIKKRHLDFQRCYEGVLEKNPQLGEVRVNVSFVVDTDGTVKEVTVLQGSGVAALDECIVAAWRATRFSGVKTKTKVSYPLTFRPPGN
jgi:TonB family protein